jgi:hypothetical protein
MNADELKAVIDAAFSGVSLGEGVSLRQAEAIDNNGEGLSEEEYKKLRQYGCTDDWKRVDLYEWTPSITFLDSLGYRYYIPAYMCSLIDNPAPGDLLEICTLQSMYTCEKHRDYQLAKFANLNFDQKRAIALFLEWHMNQSETYPEDRARSLRAIADYWHAYLDPALPNQSTNPTP